MTMTPRQIAAVLDAHDISWAKTDADHLTAASHYVDASGISRLEWIDTTGWSARKLYRWLGY
jgi:hypothetical protein